MNKVQKLGCACEKPTSNYTEYRTSELGIDHANGSNAVVSIQQCKLCQRIWIHYSIKSQNLLETEKWYKGIVSKKDRPQITPENTVEFLESLDWYVYGGAFYGNEIAFGEGKINLDL